MIASNCIETGPFSENKQEDANGDASILQHISVSWKALRNLATREEFKRAGPAFPMQSSKARCKKVRDAIEVAVRYLAATHPGLLLKRLSIYLIT